MELKRYPLRVRAESPAAKHAFRDLEMKSLAMMALMGFEVPFLIHLRPMAYRGMGPWCHTSLAYQSECINGKIWIKGPI